MNTLTKKQAIVQSLESMNASEMDRVLDYIERLLYNEALDQNYVDFKEKALREIQLALQSGEVEVPA